MYVRSVETKIEISEEPRAPLVTVLEACCAAWVAKRCLVVIRNGPVMTLVRWHLVYLMLSAGTIHLDQTCHVRTHANDLTGWLA